MSTFPEGYIVESTSRGILIDQDATGPFEYKSTWSWSKPRSEAKRFVDIKQAQWAMSRLTDSERKHAQIRRWGSWRSLHGLNGSFS